MMTTDSWKYTSIDVLTGRLARPNFDPSKTQYKRFTGPHQMQTLFKILVISMLLATHVGAQTNLKKPDVIQKIDRTSLEVVIDEINKTDILYRKANDPKGPLYALPRKDINKIIWNNGDVEEITPMPVAVADKAKAAVPAKAEKPAVSLQRQDGLYVGLRAGIGLGLTKATEKLAGGSKPVYQGGATIGLRGKTLGIQLDALYTVFSYEIAPPASAPGVKTANGQQVRLMLPLTATLYTRLGNMRAGLQLGAFASTPLGPGSTKVTFAEAVTTNYRNCSSCTGSAQFGVAGGVTATLVERPAHSIYLDVRYYHVLGNNDDYKIAEDGVKLSSALLGAGVLFHLRK